MKTEVKEGNDEIWQTGDTRLPSSTCVTNMAALLRYGAARSWRLLTACTVRNLSIYQRNSPALYQENILKACTPSVNSSRCLTYETLANEATENTTEVGAAASDSQIARKETGSGLGHYHYERNVKQLGTIFTRHLLLRTFNEILKRGKVSWQFSYIIFLLVSFDFLPKLAAWSMDYMYVSFRTWDRYFCSHAKSLVELSLLFFKHRTSYGRYRH